jgi:hypothetical protein
MPLVVKGVDLPAFKNLLGRSNITATLKYAHTTPAHRRSTVDVLVAEKLADLPQMRFLGRNLRVQKQRIVFKTYWSW